MKIKGGGFFGGGRGGKLMLGGLDLLVCNCCLYGIFFIMSGFCDFEFVLMMDFWCFGFWKVDLLREGGWEGGRLLCSCVVECFVRVVFS